MKQNKGRKGESSNFIRFVESKDYFLEIAIIIKHTYFSVTVQV